MYYNGIRLIYTHFIHNDFLVTSRLKSQSITVLSTVIKLCMKIALELFGLHDAQLLNFFNEFHKQLHTNHRSMRVSEDNIPCQW